MKYMFLLLPKSPGGQKLRNNDGEVNKMNPALEGICLPATQFWWHHNVSTSIELESLVQSEKIFLVYFGF